MNPEREASLRNIKLTDVQTLDELDQFRRWLGERRPILGVDIETGGLALTDRIRTVQFGDAREGYCLAWEDWRGAVRHVLDRYEGPLVGHNIKFDYGRLTWNGLTVPWERSHDSMMMLHLIDSLGPKALKPAAGLHIGPLARAGQRTLSKRMTQNKWTWDTIPVHDPVYTGYGMLDTCITAILAEELWPRVQYAREAYDLEMACSRVLMDMELRGARIDVPYIQRESGLMESELEELMARLGGINPNSAGSIIAALMERGARFTKFTEKGQLSTDDDVMKELEAEGFELAGLIREARGHSKVLGSYFSNWLRSEVDGFLHPSINQIAARTGRMSITNPALQTLHKTKRVRRAFIPREGNKLVLVDYDNQELRLAAHFSGDESMLRAFAEGRDLHSETAVRIFGAPFEDCSHDWKCKHRAVGKTGMLGKVYGSGVDTFADTVGMNLQEAAAIHKALDEMYPGLVKKMAAVSRAVQLRARESGSDNGFVTILDGRRLSVPSNKPYKGFNALIQGSAASILKRAIVDLDLAGLGEFMVFPIHDEMMFDVPTHQLEDVVPEIKRVMTRNDFRAPLTVGPDVVSDWGEKYE